MAITVVQSIAHAGNPPATFGAGTTAGNTVFLVVAGYTTSSGNPTTSAVKLGGSTVPNTQAFFNTNNPNNGVLSPLSGGNGAYIAIWMLPNVPGGQTTVDYTASGFSGTIGQCIYEVSGLGTAPVLDKSNSGGSASGTAVSSGASGAITSAPEIVFGGTMAFAGTPATNSGWTCLQPAGGTDLCAGYQIAVSSGGSYTWSQTSSGSPWAAFVATVSVTPAPPVVPPFFPVTWIRARLPGPFRKGRHAARAGAPVNNPGVVPVYGAIGGAVRAALPVNLRGRVASNPGTLTPVAHTGPPFPAAHGPVRARFPLPPRGRAASNSGAPVRNPSAGPAFRQLTHPARAVIPQVFSKGRVASNPGGPLRNPSSGPSAPYPGQPAGLRVVRLFAGRTLSTRVLTVFVPPPTVGPQFTPLHWPARARITPPPRGRIGSSPGGPVQNPPPPTTGPVFRPAVQAIRIRPSLPPRGRTTGGQGAPVRNPVPGAAFPALHGPVVPRLPLQPLLRGRATGNQGAPVNNPVPPQTGPPFIPLHWPARIRPSLPPRGRVSANQGAPVRNPHPGPVFTQAVRPIRAVIPQNAPRGRVGSNRGGPVSNIPLSSPLFRLDVPGFQWAAGTPVTSS